MRIAAVLIYLECNGEPLSQFTVIPSFSSFLS